MLMLRMDLSSLFPEAGAEHQKERKAKIKAYCFFPK